MPSLPFAFVDGIFICYMSCPCELDNCFMLEGDVLIIELVFGSVIYVWKKLANFIKVRQETAANLWDDIEGCPWYIGTPWKQVKFKMLIQSSEDQITKQWKRLM